MHMPAQIQLKTVKTVEIEPESAVPNASSDHSMFGIDCGSAGCFGSGMSAVAYSSNCSRGIIHLVWGRRIPTAKKKGRTGPARVWASLAWRLSHPIATDACEQERRFSFLK